MSNVSESLFASVVMVHLCVQDSRVFHTVVTDCKRHKHEDEGSCFVYCFGIIETRDSKTIFLLQFWTYPCKIYFYGSASVRTWRLVHDNSAPISYQEPKSGKMPIRNKGGSSNGCQTW